MKEFLDVDSLQIIENLIKSTQKHLPIYQEGLNGTLNRILLDIDLSILATSWDTYQNYTKAIRREYLVYSDEEFKYGRKLVMQKFLERPSMYYTTIFCPMQQEIRI